MKKFLKTKNRKDAEVKANNRTEAGTRLREIRVRFWRTSNRVFFVLILICILIFNSTSPVHAETLRISPVILKLELSPGKKTEQVITVDNLLNSPLPLKATIDGFDANDEENGYKVTGEVVNSPLTKWINLDKADTIIPANSSEKFLVTINVPSEVPFGGYYAIIFFTPLITPLESADNSQINAKIGALALANIGTTAIQSQAEILDFSLNKKFFQNDSPKVTLRLKNTGLNFFTAQPQLSIKPFFGKTENLDFEEKTVLPGKVRRWEKNLDLKNHTGVFYTISLKTSLGNDQKITSSSYFFGFPIKQLSIYTASFILTFYLLRHFKRVIKAIKLLFKSDQ